jgi:hypothetical protein
MKNIKKTLKDYINPKTNEVDWSQIVGHSILYSESINHDDIVEIGVQDYMELETGIYIKTNDNKWKRIFKNYIIAVIEKLNLFDDDELKKYILLEKESFTPESNRNDNDLLPLPFPKKPWECISKCSVCGLKSGKSMGYVCSKWNCPLGFGPTLSNQEDEW